MATIEAMVASRLSEQLRNQQHGLPAGTSSPSPAFPSFESDGSDLKTPTKAQSPSKSRSMSDSTPRLSPSPNIKSTVRRSKDDHTISAAPQTPRRPEVARGLSLQMPIKHDGKSPFTGVVPTPGPLSPKLDSRSIHGSPAALPRHSRGLDFSRACTNLHHSTLAEQSSPDSSPTITQKGIPIPIKSSLSMNSMILDSPQMHGSSWSQGGNADRSMVSGSVSSVNMLDSSSSDSDGDDAMEHDDNEDLMISTPQAYKLMDGSAPTPFPNTMAAPKPVYWPNPSGGAPHSFMSFHRARMRHRRSRQSSSSASGHSSLASPIPQSPPNGRADGYFGRDAALKKVASRRESLSLGTNDLHISSGSGNDSGDEAGQSGVSTPNVVQRPVTRRGNLLVRTAFYHSCSLYTDFPSPKPEHSVASAQRCSKRAHQSTPNPNVRPKSSAKCVKVTRMAQQGVETMTIHHSWLLSRPVSMLCPKHPSTPTGRQKVYLAPSPARPSKTRSMLGKNSGRSLTDSIAHHHHRSSHATARPP